MAVVWSVALVTPIAPELEPSLNQEGMFAFPPATVNGLPWWAFKIIILAIIPTCLVARTVWMIPDDYPVDEKKIAEKGVDPDTLNMNSTEFGRRTSYDEPNQLIRRRRSTLTEQMKDMGLLLVEDTATRKEGPKGSEDNPTSSPALRRLTSLIQGHSDIQEEIDGEGSAKAGVEQALNAEQPSESDFEVGL